MDHLNPYRDVGILHLYGFLWVRFAQIRPDDAVHRHRVGFEIGVIATCMDLEGIEIAAFPKGVHCNLAHDLEVSFALEAARDTRNAGHVSDDVGNLVGKVLRCPLFEENAKAPRYAVDGHDWIIAKKRLDILDETLLENRAITALKADFVVMDQADPLMQFLH